MFFMINPLINPYFCLLWMIVDWEGMRDVSISNMSYNYISILDGIISRNKNTKKNRNVSGKK